MFRRVTALALATALTAVSTAWADDIEIYQSNAAAKGAQPNVLFVIDTSISMNTLVKLDRAPFDPTKDYPGTCAADQVYFTTGSAPNCSTANHFPASSNVCSASFAALKSDGVGVWPAFDQTKRVVQYRGTAWTTLLGGDAGQVECQADEGIHGAATGDSAKWLLGGKTGTTVNAKWATSSKNRWGDLRHSDHNVSAV